MAASSLPPSSSKARLLNGTPSAKAPVSTAAEVRKKRRLDDITTSPRMHRTESRKGRPGGQDRSTARFRRSEMARDSNGESGAEEIACDRYSSSFSAAPFGRHLDDCARRIGVAAIDI